MSDRRVILAQELHDGIAQDLVGLGFSIDALISGTDAKNYNYELLRVLSEILRNVSEHSQASHLSIQISDNGIGGAQSKEGSFGLLGIQERITQLNGDIRIDSSQKGTTINIELPLER